MPASRSGSPRTRPCNYRILSSGWLHQPDALNSTRYSWPRMTILVRFPRLIPADARAAPGPDFLPGADETCVTISLRLAFFLTRFNYVEVLGRRFPIERSP